jgi:hypothetical protein
MLNAWPQLTREVNERSRIALVEVEIKHCLGEGKMVLLKIVVETTSWCSEICKK